MTLVGEAEEFLICPMMDLDFLRFNNFFTSDKDIYGSGTGEKVQPQDR